MLAVLLVIVLCLVWFGAIWFIYATIFCAAILMQRHVHGGRQHTPGANIPLTIKFLRANWSPSLVSQKCAVDLADIKHRLPYQPSKHFVKTTMHNGQVKLLLTEIEFLTYILPSLDTRAIVVYAGSAPSHKYPFLRSLFPNVKFVLVDPHEHLFIDGNRTQYDSPQDYLYIMAAGSNDHVTTQITGMDKEKEQPSTVGKPINLYDDARAAPHLITRTTAKQGSLPANLARIIQDCPQKTVIIEDYMTDHLAGLLAPLTNMYFISDIRTRVDNEGPDQSPSDLDILWNSALMYNWLAILKPAKYMLKFRTPFGRAKDKAKLAADYAAFPITHHALQSCPIKFIENFNQNKFIYLAAEHIWLQAFPGHSSTETRLVGSWPMSGVPATIEYDCDSYDDHLFYYNRVQRSFGHHPECADYIDKSLPTDHCGDCALSRHILASYIAKFSDKRTPLMLLKECLGAIDRNLKGDLHGKCDSRDLEAWCECLQKNR